MSFWFGQGSYSMAVTGMSRKLERPWRSVVGWKASPPQSCACASEDKSLPLSDSTKLSPLSWELFLPPRNGILLGFGLGFCVCSLSTQQRNGQKSNSQKYPNTRQRAFPTLMSSYISIPTMAVSLLVCHWASTEVTSERIWHQGIIWCSWLLKSFIKENLLLSTQSPNNLALFAYSKKSSK